MLHIKTESDFYQHVGHAMRRARKHKKISPYVMASRMRITWSLYMAIEKGQVPISAYQLYLFMKNISPESDIKNDWPNIV